MLKISGGCLDGVWKVFGRCLEGVRRLSGMCPEGVWRVSGMCLEGVSIMSPRSLEGVWRVSGVCRVLSIKLAFNISVWVYFCISPVTLIQCFYKSTATLF